tara:strand:+ start:48 stop:554 length:507 start_codon:yes stop_codon:yes gene_type:complete
MKIFIPKKIKETCWKFLSNHTLGNRGIADGNKKEQFVGLVGEVLTKEIFGIKHKFENGFDGGFDFKYQNKKIDVKTMSRIVDIKDHYVHNFIAFQQNYNCDVYIFNSINKKTNELTICGWVTKKELKERSIFYKKGTIRKRSDGSSFKMKADTFEIKNNMLNNIKELL